MKNIYSFDEIDIDAIPDSREGGMIDTTLYSAAGDW